MEDPVWGYGAPTIRIVEDRFCVPYTLELSVKKKIQGLSNVHYDVVDATGNVLLQVDGAVWNLNRKRVMRDPAGFPVLTLREKALTLKHQWRVHQGQSSSEHNNVLFCVQQSRSIQIKRQLDVFLGSTFSKTINDFHLAGCVSSLSFKVYKDSTVIAEVKHGFTWGSLFKGRERFKVKVYPEVDYAFIVALLVILDESGDD